MCFPTYFCVQSEHTDGFEGLRAEECGILNGCENGRCVRVREGYTCDCFDGYEFDLNKMACIGEFFPPASLSTDHPQLDSVLQGKMFRDFLGPIGNQSQFNLVSKCGVESWNQTAVNSPFRSKPSGARSWINVNEVTLHAVYHQAQGEALNLTTLH